MMKKNIYCTITTLVDWQDKLKEAKELGLKEVAVFLIGLSDEKQEKEFFDALAESGIESVPFAHLRNTTKPENIRLLIKKYGTRVFNVHLEDRFPLKYDLSEFKNKIFVENLGDGIEHPELLPNYAGICADFAHLENARQLLPDDYSAVLKIMSKYPIGCAHLSAVLSEPYRDAYNGELRVDSHTCSDLSEFDYLQNYKEMLPEIMAIELNDDLKTQLKVREYLVDLLKI